MTTPNNNTVDPNVPNPATNPQPIPYTLDALIDQWEKEGLTLELIVALVMSDPQGLGAMDNCSDSIAGITEQSNILSKVQADIISMDAVLSKIESQLGVSKGAINTAWAKNKSALTGEMAQLKQAYVALYGDGTSTNKGDLAALENYEAKYPALSAVIGAVKAWQGSFTNNISNTAGVNAGTFNFAADIMAWKSQNPSAGNLKADFEDLGIMHYNANHPTSTSGTPTDPVSNMWQSGNEAQTLASGQSQQDTTEVQSLMQLLQGYDSDGQQMLQLAATAKTAMIQNQKSA